MPYFLAFLTAFLMAVGQILFKVGADRLVDFHLRSFLTNPFIIFAILIYAFTILIWIYVLRLLPLSVAYPINSLAFIFVPLAAYFFLEESINIFSFIGGILIISGIFLIIYKT